MKYRKKPVVIEAVQWFPVMSPDELPQWFWDYFGQHPEWHDEVDGSLLIRTLEGDMRAIPGDWIIKGVAGEIYPCKPAIFNVTYEKVEE